MSEFLGKMKDMLPGGKEGDNDESVKKRKRKTENLIVLLVLLVVVIVSINFIFKEDKNDAKENTGNIKSNEVTSTNSSNSNDLESKLKELLNKIQGVSDIDLVISYSSDTKKVPVYNEKKSETNTQEDSNGTKKNTTQTDSDKNVAYEENGSSKTPIYEQNITPTVEGVIVVGKGVSNQEIKNTIITAVSVVTGVPIYKVQVFEKGE